MSKKGEKYLFWAKMDCIFWLIITNIFAKPLIFRKEDVTILSRSTFKKGSAAMPHSSGGGSHRGGSHRSSSHSSRRSHSSGSSYSRKRVRSSYFPGARRYVYLRKGKPEYVYADHDITKRPSPLRFFVIILYLPFLFVFYTIFKDTMLPPKKLAADYDTAIVVRDEINVLGDTEKLKRSLEAFFNKTGITPAVFTVHNEEWQNTYDGLENYAYDLYVNAFSDEKHWLIVYSEPENPDPSFNDWYWEGMQGDDTSEILTSGKADKFGSKLQRSLTDKSVSVSDAISLSFDYLTPDIMYKSVDPVIVIVLLVFIGFIVIHAFFMIFYDPNRKYRNAQEIPLETPAPTPQQNETCPYCGASYASGQERCPNCQALIGVADKKE